MALFGNAHPIDPAQAAQDYAKLLGQGETVHTAYLLIRDTILFTDNRDPTGYPVVADLEVYTAGGSQPPEILEIAVVDGSNIQLRADKVTVAYQRDGEPYGGIWIRPVPPG